MGEKFVIKGLENGPLLIGGRAAWTDADGQPRQSEGKMIALCRCGRSQNKPFCDGSHKKAGFQAPPVELTIQE